MFVPKNSPAGVVSNNRVVPKIFQPRKILARRAFKNSPGKMGCPFEDPQKKVFSHTRAQFYTTIPVNHFFKEGPPGPDKGFYQVNTGNFRKAKPFTEFIYPEGYKPFKEKFPGTFFTGNGKEFQCK